MPPTKARKPARGKGGGGVPWDTLAKVRRVTLLGVAFGVPVVLLRSTNDPVNVPKLTLLMFGVAIVASLRFTEVFLERRRFEAANMLVPAAAIAGPLILAWLFSPYKAWSLMGNYPRFVGLLPYLLAVAFGLLLLDSFRRDVEPLLWALIASGAVVGAYAALQAIGLDPYEWVGKSGPGSANSSSTLGNPNFVGGFLAMVLPLGVGMFLVADDRRRLVVGLMVPVILGWVAARSEGGWAAGLAGLAIILGHAMTTRWRKARMLGAVVAGVIFVGVIGSVLMNIGRDEPVISTTLARRADWWEGAAAMAADSPVLGRGPGLYALEGTMYRTAQDGRVAGYDFTDDPHSVWLSFLTSAGVTGLIGLLVAFTWLFREGSRVRSTDLFGASFLGAVVAYVVQASVSVDTVALRVGFWTVAAGLLAARSLGEGPHDLSKPRSSRSARNVANYPPTRVLPAVVVLLLGLGGLVWATRFALSDMRLRQALKLVAEGQGTEALAEFDSALSLRNEPPYRRVYGRTVGSIAVALSEQEATGEAQTLFERAQAAFAYTRELPHANSVADHARFLLTWSVMHPDAREEAISLFERALELDPRNTALQAELEAAHAQEASED